MASGAKREYHGSFIATGAQLDVTTIGFRPTRVDLYTDQGIEGHYTEAFADAAAFKRIANGTGSVIAVGGITPLANGFRLGTDAGLNVATRKVYFSCAD